MSIQSHDPKNHAQTCFVQHDLSSHIGLGYNPTTTTTDNQRDLRPIERAMEETDGLLECLSDHLDSLERRLEPAMSDVGQSEPKAAGTPGAPDLSSSITLIVKRHNRALQSSLRRLEEIFDRLEC